MASETSAYNEGVESRVVDGEEQYAIWVPLPGAEAEAIKKKAQAENVNVRYLIANMLRAWLGSGELSVADLDAVVGGAGTAQPIGTLSSISQIGAYTAPTISADALGKLGSSATTTMCAW